MVLKGEIFNPLRTEYLYKDLQHSNLCSTNVLKGLTRIPFRDTDTGPANQRLYKYHQHVGDTPIHKYRRKHGRDVFP